MLLELSDELLERDPSVAEDVERVASPQPMSRAAAANPRTLRVRSCMESLRVGCCAASYRVSSEKSRTEHSSRQRVPVQRLEANRYDCRVKAIPGVATFMRRRVAT